jgi:hypothetical protein
LKTIGLSNQQTGVILNYVNGRRSVPEIRAAVAGELNEEISLESVIACLELLRTVQWIVF